MQKRRIRWQWLVGYAIIALLTAGCFQSGGSGAEPVSVEFGPTFTPFPTNTLEPTALPTVDISVTPEELVPLPTQESFQIETIPTDATFGDTTGQGGGLDLLPTESFGATTDLGAPAIAQVPTTDPNLVQQQQIDPVFLTATAIIAGATATQAYNLTATAGGVFFPTATSQLPTVGPIFTTFTPTPLPGGTCVHQVAAGENLFRISLRYGVTIADIANRNGITNQNLIVVGQQLNIPNCGGTIPAMTSTPGVISPGGQTYTVQQGDTLFQISLRFGVPVMSIAAANGIADINRIYINQQLTIPSA